jgi:hypothetical protein
MRQQPASTILRFTVCMILVLLTACTAVFPPPTSTPTSTPSPIPATSTPIPTATATPIPSPTPIPAPARATYTLNTMIDYDLHTVTVDEVAIYPNHTGQNLDRLVLAAVPNLWSGSFTLTSFSIDGASATYTLDGQRLEVTLPAPLLPETVTTLSIQYTLTLPFAEQEDPSISRPRIYGYTSRQLNLTNWYPFVVPFINGDFVLHDPWYYGEHLVYDPADYEVNLRFTDPASAPVVASSGLPEPQDGFTRYTLTAGRTFALSASRVFQVSALQVGDVIITSYYFSFNEGAGQAALQASAEAVQAFSQRYGPYPHKTLAIVMGDFNDGMEFSAFFYLSKDFYSLYDFTPKNYLTFVAVHETSHQWWFEQVANDQALQPWLDESLTTYSERIYYETYHPDMLAWWWSYRIDFYNPQGFVDTPIYDGQGFRPYTNAVYFRGAHFLEDLRGRIGDEAFFAFIQDYYTQGNGKIVTANDFFRILKTHTTVDISDLVRQYFQNAY